VSSTTSAYALSFINSGFYINTTYVGFSGATDIVNLFDFYRIDRVCVTFIANTISSTSANLNTALPYLFTAIDYNDADIPTLSSITQAASCAMVLSGINAKPYVTSREFTPRAAAQVYGTATTSAYAETPLNTWFANASTAPPVHYGLKFVIDATNMTTASTNIQNLRVMVKVSLSLKGPK